MSDKFPRIGLTGSLASGKTTVLKEFQRVGWKTFSADEIVKEIYRKEGLTKGRLRKEYGASRRKLKALERWVHPQVKKELRKRLRGIKKPVVVEVPLLLEAGMKNFFDSIIYVFAPKRERKKRALRRGMSAKLFDFLESQQWPILRKVKAADFIVHNI